MRKRIVEVLVPVALDHTYSYGVPDGLELEPGDLVGVPLGASDTLGVVWRPRTRPSIHGSTTG